MFMTAGKSLVLAFGVVTSMRRSAERLRSVARILNYPTDAHVLAAQVSHTAPQTLHEASGRESV